MTRMLAFWVMACAATLSQQSASANAPPAGSRDYVWFTAGTPSGRQTVTTEADERISVHFSYNDRGRGPDLNARYRMAGNATLSEFEVKGLNYSKSAVEEYFSDNGSVAVWHSSQEQGQSDRTAGRIYYPVNQVPEFRAVMARALLASPDRSIGLLQGGTVQIEEVRRLSLPTGAGLREATLYAILGIGLVPSYVWLDADKRLIGYVDGWFAILESGWTDHLARLRAEQDAARDRYISAQSARHRRHVPGDMVIRNARVLHMRSGRLTRPKTVLIRDGKIIHIGGVKIAARTDAHQIDAGGKTLMPALWDMHGHIGADDYLHYLASGVLNVRDMGNDPDYLASLRAQIEEGSVAAPDIYPMGFIDKRGPFSAPTGKLADTLDEARGHVQSYVDAGYAGIKLYSSIEPDWVATLAGDAKARKMAVAGHIPSFMSPQKAIESGYSEITHINMVMLQLIGDPTIDSRTPQRFTEVGARGGLIDPAAGATDTFIRMMAGSGIAHDPTLAIFMNQYHGRPGQPLPSAVEFIDHLPPVMRREQVASVSYNEGKEEQFRRTGDVALKLIKRVYDHGVHILPGTDASLPGFTLISELQYYARAGIDNRAILRMATIDAARHMGQQDMLGSVMVGKKAHLILVDGNPVRDLAALRRVDLVIKGKDLFFPRSILESQGIAPF